MSEIGIGIARFSNKPGKELQYTTYIVLQTAAISDTEKVQGMLRPKDALHWIGILVDMYMYVKGQT